MKVICISATLDALIATMLAHKLKLQYREPGRENPNAILHDHPQETLNADTLYNVCPLQAIAGPASIRLHFHPGSRELDLGRHAAVALADRVQALRYLPQPVLDEESLSPMKLQAAARRVGVPTGRCDKGNEAVIFVARRHGCVSYAKPGADLLPAAPPLEYRRQ
jgi:hypothetical protein